jgi:hypothetical protein
MKCYQKDHQIVRSGPIHLMKSINYGDYNLNLVFEKMTIISVIALIFAKNEMKTIPIINPTSNSPQFGEEYLFSAI